MNPRAFCAVVLLACCCNTDAAPIVYSGHLSGAGESPPNSSTGSGSTVVSYDAATHSLSVQATFTGLSGNTTASHIHCCITAGNDASGVATQVPTFANFPLGVAAGTYSMTFDLTLSASWNPSFVTASGGTPAGAESALAAGLVHDTAYLNIHSSTFGGGEIRSFLTPDGVFANGFE